MKKHKHNIKYPSRNFDVRPEDAKISFLILHSTECDLLESLRILTDDMSSYPVSAHYVVDETGDIYHLVEEKFRAWHAGKDSRWAHYERLNATSIGIEIVNTEGNKFKSSQMQSLSVLAADILKRHSILPRHVLAHSDIALGRKRDPGNLFDWKWLAAQGVGLHPESNQGVEEKGEEDLIDFFPLSSSHPYTGGIPPLTLSSNLEAILKLQDLLKFIGYSVSLNGFYDSQTRNAVKAFQMKFRQHDVSGEIDIETLDLLRKYKSLL